MKGVLAVVSGFSGVGKGTVVGRMREQYPFMLSVSAATRAPREGEVDGVSYHFISEEEFARRIEQGYFLEWAKYTQGYYGTPKAPVLEALERGEDVLLEIEAQGAFQVKEQYPEALLIFVLPPSFTELENRLRGRGTETEDQIRRRMARSIEEFQYIPNYDAVVVNHEIETCAGEIFALMDARRHSPKTQEDMILQLKEEALTLQPKGETL